ARRALLEVHRAETAAATRRARPGLVGGLGAVRPRETAVERDADPHPRVAAAAGVEEKPASRAVHQAWPADVGPDQRAPPVRPRARRWRRQDVRQHLTAAGGHDRLACLVYCGVSRLGERAQLGGPVGWVLQAGVREVVVRCDWHGRALLQWHDDDAAVFELGILGWRVSAAGAARVLHRERVEPGVQTV